MMREISILAKKKVERLFSMGNNREASKGRPQKYSKSGASDSQDCDTVNLSRISS